jgi:hypothetical protein
VGVAAHQQSLPPCPLHGSTRECVSFTSVSETMCQLLIEIVDEHHQDDRSTGFVSPALTSSSRDSTSSCHSTYGSSPQGGPSLHRLMSSVLVPLHHLRLCPLTSTVIHQTLDVDYISSFTSTQLPQSSTVPDLWRSILNCVNAAGAGMRLNGGKWRMTRTINENNNNTRRTQVVAVAQSNRRTAQQHCCEGLTTSPTPPHLDSIRSPSSLSPSSSTKTPPPSPPFLENYLLPLNTT